MAFCAISYYIMDSDDNLLFFYQNHKIVLKFGKNHKILQKIMKNRGFFMFFAIFYAFYRIQYYFMDSDDIHWSLFSYISHQSSFGCKVRMHNIVRNAAKTHKNIKKSLTKRGFVRYFLIFLWLFAVFLTILCILTIIIQL